MPVTHDALVARLGLKIRISLKKVSDFRLDSLRQQRMRSVAQNLSERIAESPWLSELDHVGVGHGVSLLWWRSGGVKHLHDTPPHPFMPSPTSAHSSEADLVDQLFNSSEMRLARALLLLANYGNDVGLEPLPIDLNQETLAELIGTT